MDDRFECEGLCHEPGAEHKSFAHYQQAYAEYVEVAKRNRQAFLAQNTDGTYHICLCRTADMPTLSIHEAP